MITTTQQQQNKHQKLWKVISIAIIVLYFWIYSVFLDLTYCFCNHIVLMKLCCIRIFSLAFPNCDIFILCHAEFGLVQANEVVFQLVPHLSALLGHI